MDATTTPPPATYSARQAANVLGISERTVYDLTNAGSLPHLHVGRRTLIPRDALHAWITEHTTGGKA